MLFYIITLFLQPEICDSVSRFVAYAHQSVNVVSEMYLQNERRYNYTTPKSFLEQIKLYQNLLDKKHGDLQVFDRFLDAFLIWSFN